MIAGLFVAPDTAGKLAFVKVWKYFVSEVVTSDDIYCSIPIYVENNMFEKYVTPHSVIDGLQIYKVDNFLKEQYSAYTKHLEGRSSG